MIASSKEQKKNLRIQIVPTLKASYSLAFEAKKYFLILGWLPFLLFTTFGLIDSYFLILDFITEPLISLDLNISSQALLDFFYYTANLMISAAFVIALYEFFILDRKNNFYVWGYKRGVYEEKNVFSIPWYFRLGNKEFKLIVVFLLLGAIFDILRQINFSMTIYNAESAGKVQLDTFDQYVFIFGKYSIWFVEGLVFASLIFVSPAIAVRNFKYSEISSLFRAVRGNIFRIFIIVQIIFLPVFLFEYLYQLIMYFISPLEGLTRNFVSGFYLILSNFIFYVCIAIECTFISIIYKELCGEKSEIMKDD